MLLVYTRVLNGDNMEFGATVSFILWRNKQLLLLCLDPEEQQLVFRVEVPSKRSTNRSSPKTHRQ